MSAGSGLFANQRAARPHLVRGSGGLAGEVSDLRADVSDELGAMAAMAVEEFIDPIAADTDGLVLSQASVAAIVSLSGAGLDGALAGTVFDPPRNVTIDTAGVTPADAPATGTVTGTDINDQPLIEVITVSQVLGQAVGISAFKTVDQIDFPAADGVAALLEVGIGDVFGLAKPIKSRAGLADLIREIVAGALVTSGTVVDAATSAPNGTYEPATVADAANDYAVYYEWDAS